MDMLEGKTLLRKTGEEFSEVTGDEALQDKQVVGYYFSAHWCPPCRMFTPSLAECYKELKDGDKPFEIVFVSSDQDDSTMRDYMMESHGDWLAIPYDEEQLKQDLSEKFKVEGIPTLVIVKQSGEMITENGRMDVSAKGANAFDSWEKGTAAVTNPEELMGADSSEEEKDDEKEKE